MRTRSRQSDPPHPTMSILFPAFIELDVTEINPSPDNPKRHPERQIQALMGSIKEFGFVMPILVSSEREIIAGHGIYEAARRLGMTRLPCMDAAHLTDAQVKAYRIADNKLAELGEWDEDALRSEFTALTDLGFDLQLTGFQPFEIEATVTIPDFEPAGEATQGRLDRKAPVVCPNCGHEFTA